MLTTKIHQFTSYFIRDILKIEVNTIKVVRLMKALITGASSGIGLEMAKILAKNNHDLILVSKDKEKLQKVKEQLGDKVKIIVADLSIVVARLMYPEDIRHDANKLEYQKQLKFIETYDRRNIAILNIIKNFPQTGLLLYKHIKHGEFLYEKAREMFPDRNVYLIHGGYFMMNDKKYKT